MKYIDVIANLKRGAEIRYYYDGNKKTYTIEIDDDGFEVKHQTIHKLWREHTCYHRIYAIENNEESGWLDVQL